MYLAKSRVTWLSVTDTSSNDEGETIAETPPERLSGVPRLKRENAFIATDFPARKKSNPDNLTN